MGAGGDRLRGEPDHLEELREEIRAEAPPGMPLGEVRRREQLLDSLTLELGDVDIRDDDAIAQAGALLDDGQRVARRAAGPPPSRRHRTARAPAAARNVAVVHLRRAAESAGARTRTPSSSGVASSASRGGVGREARVGHHVPPTLQLDGDDGGSATPPCETSGSRSPARSRGRACRPAPRRPRYSSSRPRRSHASTDEPVAGDVHRVVEPAVVGRHRPRPEGRRDRRRSRRSEPLASYPSPRRAG